MKPSLPALDPIDPQADPRQLVSSIYDHWTKCTPGGEAAALALAEIQLRIAQGAQAVPVSPQLDAPPPAPDALLTLQEAADCLRLSPTTLRRIAKRKGIQFMQSGEGPMKFRREWLDEYVAANVTGPQDVERTPARKYTRRPIVAPQFGFDPGLL